MSITSFIKQNKLESFYPKASKAFKKNDHQMFGKLYNKYQEDSSKYDECKKFLDDHYNPSLIKRDFDPTAKCRIVAHSKESIADWEISKVSKAIQEIFYKAKKDNPNVFDIKETKESRNTWLARFNIKTKYTNAQGLNLLFKNAKNIYLGVLEKHKNKEEKILSRIKKTNDFRKKKGLKLLPIPIIDPVVDDNGYLLNPPGINNTLFGYQSCKLQHLENQEIIKQLPEPYNTYSRKNGDVIPVIMKITDRLNIKNGNPGFIKYKNLVNLYNEDKTLKSKRRRNRNNKNQNPILMVAYFGEDWVVFDARGLLRDLYFRKIAKPGKLKIEDLLTYFTKDPVVYPTSQPGCPKGIVRLSYKEGIIEQPTYKVRNNNKFLKQELQKQSLACISIDLGQTNPVAYRISSLHYDKDKDVISSDFKLSNKLDEKDLKNLYKIREKTDKLEQEIKTIAINSLSEENRLELEKCFVNNPIETKQKLINEFGINAEDINDNDWESMTSQSTKISDYLIAKGKEELTINYNGKKKTDYQFAKDYKNKLSPELNKKYNETLWKEKRNNPGYLKLSKTTKETCRRIANSLVKKTEEATNLTTIINIEDLNVKSGFFDGKGKVITGWNNFFFNKKENRFFIKHFHKAFSDLAQNKGKLVFETSPKYTSQRCIKCGHIDRKNRNGEIFKCLKCGEVANTDEDIATENLELVLITGKLLSKPKDEIGSDCERSNVVKKPRTSRKKKGIKTTEEISIEPVTDEMNIMCEDEKISNLSQTKL